MVRLPSVYHWADTLLSTSGFRKSAGELRSSSVTASVRKPDPRLELRAVDAVGIDLGDHILECLIGGLRRPIAEEETRLPPVQIGFVGEKEVEEASDGGLAV